MYFQYITQKTACLISCFAAYFQKNLPERGIVAVFITSSPVIVR